MHFATCFLSSKEQEMNKKYPCDNNLLHYGNEIARQKHNLFVSAETFSIIDTYGLKMLSCYLSQWDRVTIVIFYRRYYDWLISVFNQRTKSRTLLNNNNIPYDPWNSSIIDFITDVLNGDPIPLGDTRNVGVKYTLPLLDLLEEESRG